MQSSKFYILHCLTIFTFILLTTVSCSQTTQKINGVSLVSPPQKVNINALNSVQQINANWVAIIPFAFCENSKPKVSFNHNKQWWGEKEKGVLELIEMSKQKGFKIFIKPHVWNRGAWIGDFKLTTENEWKTWEKEYTNYILSYAKIAQNNQVEMFCVGTELKQVVLKRPLFFKSLIKKVKQVYKGTLTYAANWDNVKAVNFWSELDYIGIDAYYSLSTKREPTTNQLIKAWKPIKQEIHKLSIQNNKPVLFTEYGFESSDFNTKDTWGSKGLHPANQTAQVNAYKALYKTFYKENWFAGGFLWKWHITKKTVRNKEKAFTPQDKKVEEVINQWFKKFKE